MDNDRKGVNTLCIGFFIFTFGISGLFEGSPIPLSLGILFFLVGIVIMWVGYVILNKRD